MRSTASSRCWADDAITEAAEVAIPPGIHGHWRRIRDAWSPAATKGQGGGQRAPTWAASARNRCGVLTRDAHRRPPSTAYPSSGCGATDDRAGTRRLLPHSPEQVEVHGRLT